MALADMNQKELAEKSGVDKTTICHTLAGKTSPNQRTLERLAKALGYSYPTFTQLGE
jgi:transcriptional regulator with XRE-family HTH domain